MVDVIYHPKFEQAIKKIKDALTKEKVKKQIEKVVENPEIGKPLRFDLKGLRSVRVKPFRILYEYKSNTIYFLDFDHRKSAYD